MNNKLYKYISKNEILSYTSRVSDDMTKIGLSKEELKNQGYKPLKITIEPKCPEDSYLSLLYTDTPDFIQQDWEIIKFPPTPTYNI